VLLLTTAAIWGFAFTAQRAGMEHLGPFLYTGIRFLLGTIVLLPLLIGRRRRRVRDGIRPDMDIRATMSGGALAGLFLFLGVTFQQIGLLYTTAGKAGFITGLYVILVPILGMLWKQRSPAGTWGGAAIAVAGLYLLSVTGGFTIGTGDLLVLASAFFWAFHVQIIAHFAKNTEAITLAVIQYTLCGIVSVVIALFVEPVVLDSIVDAALPIAYGGICSVGIAYTLQVVAQRTAPPAHAAIIMSLEGVFAVIGGYLVLGEVLSNRGLLGCALMLCGMLTSQLAVSRSRRARTEVT
jgi:drug/metabolite transporter (DMT)-like permease